MGSVEQANIVKKFCDDKESVTQSHREGSYSGKLSARQALTISINYSWSIFGQSLWNIPIFGWGFGFGGRVQQIVKFSFLD